MTVLLILALASFGVAAVLYSLPADAFDFPRIRRILADISRNLKEH